MLLFQSPSSLHLLSDPKDETKVECCLGSCLFVLITEPPLSVNLYYKEFKK